MSAAFFDRLLRLMALERDAEAEQLLARRSEKSGVALTNLRLADVHGGLGGRLIAVLDRRGQPPLPWTMLGTGSPVLLSTGNVSVRGVVAELREKYIAVAVEDLHDDMDDEAVYRVELAADETVRQRQKAALEAARGAREGRLAHLRDVLLGAKIPEFTAADPVAIPGLNPSQNAAVTFALTADDLAILHGPPGTGKTTTLAELVRQAVARGDKVLACAPSNLAVDNLLEKLLALGVDAVRLGHPARVLPALREHTLDVMVEEHEDFKLARKLVKEAHKLFHSADRYTRAKPEPGAKAAMRREARSLLADARRLERQATTRLLDAAPVVCVTTSAVDSGILGSRAFDLAVIDEAGQSTEPGCWIPLLRARRLVLAGDHQQLPPTVVSRDAAAAGFGVSMMERLVALYGDTVTRRLDVQYRMHPAIMAFSSAEFYAGTLVAAPGLDARRPHDLAPQLFIDTAGAGYDDEPESDGESRLNREEAAKVVDQVQALLEAGIAPRDIGVIAPYSGQVRLLRSLLRVDGLEIDSIDGFQGREKEAIVLSLVRSNPDGELGFLAETRRLNVALTRARSRLVVVGDSATLANLAFYQRLVAHFEAHAAYCSVWELA